MKETCLGFLFFLRLLRALGFLRQLLLGPTIVKDTKLDNDTAIITLEIVVIICSLGGLALVVQGLLLSAYVVLDWAVHRCALLCHRRWSLEILAYLHGLDSFRSLFE